MIVMREVIGEELRRRRQDQGRTLREVSGAAAVSLGYLSEVERGHKEASSELLAAICEALDVSLSELLASVSTQMAQAELQHTAPTTRLPAMVTAGQPAAWARPLS
jgi:transcriptional regulator with XRE-family HTH domain